MLSVIMLNVTMKSGAQNYFCYRAQFSPSPMYRARPTAWPLSGHSPATARPQPGHSPKVGLTQKQTWQKRLTQDADADEKAEDDAGEGGEALQQ